MLFFYSKRASSMTAHVGFTRAMKLLQSGGYQRPTSRCFDGKYEHSIISIELSILLLCISDIKVW